MNESLRNLTPGIQYYVVQKISNISMGDNYIKAQAPIEDYPHSQIEHTEVLEDAQVFSATGLLRLSYSYNGFAAQCWLPVEVVIETEPTIKLKEEV